MAERCDNTKELHYLQKLMLEAIKSDKGLQHKLEDCIDHEDRACLEDCASHEDRTCIEDYVGHGDCTRFEDYIGHKDCAYHENCCASY